MILPNPTRVGNTILYPIGLEREVQQYLFGSARPEFYLITLTIAFCRRMPGLKAVYFAEDANFEDVIRTQPEAYYWRRFNEANIDDDEYDLYSRASNGVALFPATRWGLQDAANLIYRTHARRWVRLVFDREFRNRISDGSLDADAFINEVESDWVVGIWSDWEGIIFDMGPQFNRLEQSVIDAAISDANEQCI